MSIDPKDLPQEQTIPASEKEPTLSQTSTAINDIGEHAIYFSSLLAAGDPIATHDSAMAEAARRIELPDLEFAEDKAIEYIRRLQAIRTSAGFPPPSKDRPTVFIRYNQTED